MKRDFTKRLLMGLFGVAVVASCAGNDPASSSSNVTQQTASDQLDRMGHVEVGPLIIADMMIADRFNQELPFSLGISEQARADYEAALTAGLIKFDHYDSYPLRLFDLRIDALERLKDERDQESPGADVLDWFDDMANPHPLLDIYMTDALFVDVSKPCGSGGYLEPELATLAGTPHETCGGRLPNEDVIDRMATVLINGPMPRAVEDDKSDDPYPDRGDAVSEPYAPAGDAFPYLPAPYDGWEEGVF